MPLVLVLILLLSGCTAAREAQLIDAYLDDSSVGARSDSLTGRALFAQERALEVVADLGWSQSGRAEYSDLRVQGDDLIFCLDISGVGFLDSAGKEVPLSRPLQKLLMRADLIGEGAEMKIENIQESGAC